jgi:hypothetical protein
MAIILIKVERFNSIFQFPSKEESVGISHVSLCERALKTDGLYYVTKPTPLGEHVQRVFRS